ncbi:MAG: class I SAM-dependent methyltransferase, partial [Bacteroidota bacterium]
IGADHWKATPEYRYTSQMVIRNAEIEGVADRIEVINADAQALPFDHESFDVVMTSLMMHHVADKSKAIKEMVRVLKPKGMLILADVGIHRFKDELAKAGITDVKIERSVRLFFMPVRILRAKKQ